MVRRISNEVLSAEDSPDGNRPWMPNQPRLLEVRVPADPDGVVLVLHGGGSRQRGVMVSPTQLSVLRMIPIARRVARAGRGRLAVFRLLNAARGWDTDHTPVDDVDWAVARLSSRFPAAPAMCLLGHSLGGRAALLAGDRPQVRSVVALAPWLYPTDRVKLSGRSVLIVHGSEDRIALPSRSEAVAHALALDTSVGYICIEGGKHAMLSHHRTFDSLAADFAVATLLGAEVGGPVGRVLGGEHWITLPALSARQ